MHLYACVDSAEWCEKLVRLGTVTDIQIRIKVRRANLVQLSWENGISLLPRSLCGGIVW